MISQSDILRACRNRTPDSFAPDGQPLMWVPLAHLPIAGHLKLRQPRKHHSGLRLPTQGRAAGTDDCALPRVIAPVGPSGQTLSSPRGSVAAAGDNTVSNLVEACAQRKGALPQQNAGLVTHRDLSQHADSDAPHPHGLGAFIGGS